MALQYLDFDYSEDAHGHGSFEAMASVTSARLQALHAEIVQVLTWAHANFAGQRAPLEEGGEWDYHLEGQEEWSVPEMFHYDEVALSLASRRGPAGAPRHTVTLTISGAAGFCAALRERFEI